MVSTILKDIKCKKIQTRIGLRTYNIGEKPIKPLEPIRPVAPDQFMEDYFQYIDATTIDRDGVSLGALLAQINNLRIDPTKVTIIDCEDPQAVYIRWMAPIDMSDWETEDVEAEWESYRKQMELFQRKFVKYAELMNKFNILEKKYQIDLENFKKKHPTYKE